MRRGGVAIGDFSGSGLDGREDFAVAERKKSKSVGMVDDGTEGEGLEDLD